MCCETQNIKHKPRLTSIKKKPKTKPANTTVASSPQSNLGRVCCYPHIEECTLPLCVLALACTMCDEALQNVTGALRSSYGT